MGRKEEIDPLKEENRRIKRLRFIVDLAAAVLMQSDITLEEAVALMHSTKKAALMLFPDKEEVYDLIYTPRFRRIIAERFKVSFTDSGWN